MLLEAFVAAVCCGSRGGNELVDELVQQTTTIAWRRFADFDQSRPFGPWLRGIAKSVAKAHFRRQARRDGIQKKYQLTHDLADRLATKFDQFDIGPASDHSEILMSLKDCLRQLPEEFAICVRLHYWSGSAMPDIAARLGIEVELARKRLQRARQKLAACLTLKGVAGFEKESTP